MNDRMIFPRKPSAGARRGSILLIALWSLFLLSSFAVILGYEVRQKLELVRRLSERSALQLAGEAGVRKALEAVRVEDEKEYQWLGDAWSNAEFLFRDLPVGDSTVSAIHYSLTARGERFPVYGLVDEESKININTAPAEVIARLFRLCGMEEGPAQDCAYSIVDWRDKDSFLSVPLGSAEDSYYRSLPYPYEAKDSDFEALDELLLVKGIEENFFKIIKSYITIYGDGRVNINTAPRVTLIALGLSADTADLLIGYRSGKDGAAGTADDTAFTSSVAVVADLSSVHRLSDGELTELSALASGNRIGVRSGHFTVSTVAKMKRGKGERSLAAVINTKGEILYVSEYD